MRHLQARCRRSSPLAIACLILCACWCVGADTSQCHSGAPAMQETVDALMGIYHKLHGSKWSFHHLTEVIGRADTGTLRWGSCSTCTVPITSVSTGRHGTISVRGISLPSYCCWRGVSCCDEPHMSPSSSSSFINSVVHAAPDSTVTCQGHTITALQLWGLGLSGPFHSIMPELQVLHSHGLRHLDLSKNALTGTLPEDIGSLTNLTHLLLGSNNISGTVPESLRDMRALLQLDLEINKLVGSLNQGQLCQYDDNSLKLLLIRGNNFSGPLDLRKCSQLQLADLQGNRFSGSLPVDGRNRALSVLRADHNSFNGSIPLGLWDLPALMALELTNNSLSGTLPKAIAAANFLTQLRLGSNKLEGTVPLAINTLSHLAELDLSDNIRLTGTLPSMNWMLGLQSLSIRHTLVGGTLPRELADLPYLETVDVRDTRMTCCGSLQEAVERKDNGTLLPSYLTLDQVAGNSSVEEEYVTAAGNMKCGMVKRSPNSSMVAQGWVSKPVNVSRQTWMVGPEYTWYMRCSCIKGYEQGPFTVMGSPSHCNVTATATEGTPGSGADLAIALNDPACHTAVTAVMTCQPSPNPPRVNTSLIAGIICSGVVLLLIMLLVYLSFKRLGRMKRQLEWWRKHLAGMPKCGEMSIVVTDIEGYSGMFKRAPEQMYRALTLHNNVIRHAKYTNCGSIIQQEGDSFILAFHTAFDAVAFCLQVQQGLMEVPWPKGLAEMSEDGSNGSSDGCTGEKPQQQGGSPGNGSSSSPPRKKLSHRLEGVSSMLLSPGSASKLRKSRLASGSPTPPPAFDITAGAAAAAAATDPCDSAAESASSSPKQLLGAAAVRSSGSFCQPGMAGSCSSGSASPTKQLAERCRRPACLQAPSVTYSSNAISMLVAAQTSATAAAAAAGGAGCVQAGSSSPTSGGTTARLASINSSKGSYFAATTASSSSRFLSSFAVGHAAGGLFRVGTSRCKHTGADGSNGAAAGSTDGSDGCGSSGLFNGLRVRMGVVTGQVHWEHSSSSNGSSSTTGNSLPAIMNSSLYKLALEVSDAGNGGQVLLDATTFSKIKEELAPLGVVDANGIDYAQLEATRPFSLWQALCGRKREWRMGGGRKRAQSDEAVVLDMGLWQKQQLPPTTPTSPAPVSAAAAATAAARSSLPGAMPQHDPNGHYHQHPFSLPVSPSSSANGGFSHDGGGWGSWGIWGSGAASAAGGGGYGGYGGGAHSCATAGSGSEHGSMRLRLYQVLSPRLAARAAVWGDALSLRGSWVCMDAPYFEAPGALFYSVLTPSSNSSSSMTTGSRTSSMTKASDMRYWQAKCLQHQQLLLQLQQQPYIHAAAAGTGSDGLSRQSSCIPAVHVIPAAHFGKGSTATAGAGAAAGGGGGGGRCLGSGQQQQAYHQLTICAADVEAPSMQDQQPAAGQSQSPVLGYRPLSSTAAAAAAAAAAAVVGVPPLLLPAVTLLFVSVEGCRVLRKHHVRDAHYQLSLLFMESLRHVSGGYMCRMQAGDLKYMVAFASAPAALQWALMTQEAAMYLDYPPTFDRVPQLRAEYDSRGQLVFRGPRLRMGLCEGVPRTVMPDHMGRADYYGSSVNMAARYMDAAAHGGQVACELELALAVMQYWADSSSCDNGNKCSSSSGSLAHQSSCQYGCSCCSSRPHDGLPRHMSGAAAVGHGVSSALASQAAAESSGSFSSSDSPLSFAPAGAVQQLVTASCICSMHGSSSMEGSHESSPKVQSCNVQQPMQPNQPPDQAAFGLPDVPAVITSVDVHCLGAFRFKGGALQQLQMVNVALSSLVGRARFIPAESPKGKGERVSVGSGIAAQGPAPLPALVHQYRARVPGHILECVTATSDAALDASASAVRDCEAVRTGSLRVTSAPQHMMLAQVMELEGSGAEGPGFGVEEIMGLRQKSHSFTCQHTPGPM